MGALSTVSTLAAEVARLLPPAPGAGAGGRAYGYLALTFLPCCVLGLAVFGWADWAAS